MAGSLEDPGSIPLGGTKNFLVVIRAWFIPANCLNISASDQNIGSDRTPCATNRFFPNLPIQLPGTRFAKVHLALRNSTRKSRKWQKQHQTSNYPYLDFVRKYFLISIYNSLKYIAILGDKIALSTSGFWRQTVANICKGCNCKVQRYHCKVSHR